jgi:EamA domain-containing membrane protein RarD
MTGVLVVCGGSYVRLLTQVASVPAMPCGLCRGCPLYPVCRSRTAAQKPQGVSIGVMADIPIAQIVLFIHSALRGDTSSYNT